MMISARWDGAPACISCLIRCIDPLRRIRHWCALIIATACTAACAVGPNYHRPATPTPDSFKEAADWRHAQDKPGVALSSAWWDAYNDDALSELIGKALGANQSIIQAEAAYRVAKATVDLNVAGLFPTIAAGASATHSGTGAGASSTGQKVVGNLFSVDLSATWEPDLWGQIRREIESAKASAQASDAQLAGERLSIAASVASDYFALRQADLDVDYLRQQQAIDEQILEMTRAGYAQGTEANVDVLVAQDTLEAVIADLQATQIAREQYEHAIAVLIGVPPEGFSIEPRLEYAFVKPSIPVGVPSELLERRYDVVSAERLAAAANAKIGVAEAAFFPTLTLSGEIGFEHDALSKLISVPNRVWTLGPQLAETIFDGGARTAQVRIARATYDEQVAAYRQTVLAAFQSVEDSLTSINHYAQQEASFHRIYENNQALFASEDAEVQAGTASRQSLLTQKLTLIQAEQNWRDTEASVIQSSVTLIKNLGGGWQWSAQPQAAADLSGLPATLSNAAEGAASR